jgi:amino acid transporter
MMPNALARHTHSRVAPRSGQDNRAHAPTFAEHYSAQVLPKVLGSFDLTSLFLLNVFWVTNVTPLAAGGAASFTYWLIGGLGFFLPCGLVIAQLAALFPTEGSIYTWTRHALGPGWGFFVGVCAWLPGVLSIVNAAAAFVACLQALNAAWLVPPWQQGLAIIGVLAFVGFFSCQRTRVVQNLLNGAAGLMLLATVLIGAAAVLWLWEGHPIPTGLTHAGSYAIVWGPRGNLALLGSVVLALMGSDMPLSMGAEVKDRRAIGRHLTWGTGITLAGYLLFTFAVLVVKGASAAANTVNPMVLLIATVDQVFGKAGGNVMALCLLFYFLMIPVALNVCFARLLLVAAFDGRVSAWFARLNRDRVPTHALIAQTLIAGLFAALLYLLVPLVGLFGSPAIFTSETYNVLGASLLLVWAVSFLFPFIDVAALWLRFPRAFHARRVIPGPLLALCVLIGTLLCGATIVITLFNSFIPALIPDSSWWYIVGICTLTWLTMCAIGSMLTNSEVHWEEMQQISSGDATPGGAGFTRPPSDRSPEESNGIRHGPAQGPHRPTQPPLAPTVVRLELPPEPP